MFYVKQSFTPLILLHSNIKDFYIHLMSCNNHTFSQVKYMKDVEYVPRCWIGSWAHKIFFFIIISSSINHNKMDEGHLYVNIALFHTGKVSICMVYLFHECYACQLKLPICSFSLWTWQKSKIICTVPVNWCILFDFC